MSTNVIPFQQYYSSRKSDRDTALRSRGTRLGPEASQVDIRTDRQTQPRPPIDIDALYPAAEGPKPEVVEALSLLATATGLLENARAEMQAKESIAADDYVQHLQVMLPDLFRYRTIGDGYGLVINSIHFGLANQAGKPLSLDQTNSVWRVLKQLRVRPFLSFDQALEYVSELEDSGLRVDPTTLSSLLAEDD